MTVGDDARQARTPDPSSRHRAGHAAATVARRRPGRPAGAAALTDRTKLLEAAERVIAANGPGVSLEAIAVEAGVTKPMLYQYVGNKDALVEALAERHMRRIDTAIGAATQLAEDRRDRARRFVAAYFGVVDEHRNLYQFLTAGGSSETLPHRSLLFADQSARPLAVVLARQRIADGTDPDVATPWAYGIIGMLHYVTLWWMRETELSIEQVVDHVTQLLWSGVGGDQIAGGSPS